MIALLCQLAFAEELTFADAVRAAVDTSPASRLTAATASADRADAHAAAALQNPEFAARHEPDRDAVELAVPVDVGAMARGAVVPDAVDAADIREKAGRAAVGAAGGAAWLDARRASDLAALAADADALAERLGAAAQARVTAGEWGADEGTLVRADGARLLDRALTAQQEADNAVARLAAVLGITGVDLALGNWPTIATPPHLDPARLPTVLAADRDARVALGNVRAERLARIPTLSLDAGYVLRGATGPTYGASITLPLFAPGTAKVQRAAGESDAAAALSEIASLDAAATVRATEAELATAERLATTWDIPGLDAVLTATVHRYDAGELSLPDYIARRDLAVEAEQNAVDARWRLARARLAAWELSGELPPEASR